MFEYLFFYSVFSDLRTEYIDIREKKPSSTEMLIFENKTNSYGEK